MHRRSHPRGMLSGRENGMATKKSPSKKTAPNEPAGKTAAKKTAEKKIAASTVDVQASAAAETQPKAAAKATAKPQPTHHEISVQAYLLWERGGKQHGQHAAHWQQAERDLAGS